MPFLDHLEELRWRLLWSLLSIAVGTVIGFWLVYRFDVLELLVVPVRRAWGDPNLKLVYLSPADPFFVMLRLAIYVGVILSLPIVVYHIWAFLSPALEKREKRAIIPPLYLAVALFLAGMSLAYFIALPMTLKFFLGFLNDSLQGQLEINQTLGFIVKMLLAFGAVFELPIVILILSVLGLVTPAFLRAKRRHAIVLITAVASFITPGDAITLTVLMMIPLVLLYELGILLSAGVQRRRGRRAAEEAAQHEARRDPPIGSVEAR